MQWGDIDIAGIMYFAAYQRFVERAEMDMFRELGFPYDRIFGEFDIWLPRVHVEATYYKPALMDDWLTMRTHIQKVGASSMRWQTDIYNERTKETGASFTVTIACIDRVQFKSRPMPQPIRQALASALAAANADLGP
ncbi:MAG: acyl-CoA thioesterase [Candidatus Eremiobacteraeota bacterium]|nr:acyl-CoA thioesterase [Candidatus Eremiobacteraeota bacterium]